MMAIGSAIQRGSLICVYDEHGRTLFSKGSGATDGLLGFTGSVTPTWPGSSRIILPVMSQPVHEPPPEPH
jgi:hypothetical protein